MHVPVASIAITNGLTGQVRDTPVDDGPTVVASVVSSGNVTGRVSQ